MISCHLCPTTFLSSPIFQNNSTTNHPPCHLRSYENYDIHKRDSFPFSLSHSLSYHSIFASTLLRMLCNPVYAVFRYRFPCLIHQSEIQRFVIQRQCPIPLSSSSSIQSHSHLTASASSAQSITPNSPQYSSRPEYVLKSNASFNRAAIRSLSTRLSIATWAYFGM